MKVVIQISRSEEAKALPILWRHSPGVALRGGKYVIEDAAAQALREAGVRFTELSDEAAPPLGNGVAVSERI